MKLSNEQYDIIMQEYDNQRILDHEIEETRRSEVYSAIPRLQDIDDQISEISSSSIKKLLNEEIYDTIAVVEKINSLINEKKELISCSGFPANYLEPVYKCPDCKDTGYIDNIPCHCFKQRSLDVIFSQSNLKGVLDKCCIDNFSLDYYSADKVDTSSGKTEKQLASKALASTYAFIDSFLTKGSAGNLLYYGDTGMGKTYLSGCVARILLENGFSVIYFSAIRLFDILRDHQFDHESGGSYDQIFDSDLLIIDDLGTENLTGFTMSQLFSVINERIQRERSTVISTNLNLIEFRDHYTERISSRIFSNYELLKLCGDDIRLRLKINQTTI
jgi:DNA replication protein DnaC